MEFVAIDFETANGNASSACQLAVVKVRDAEIVDEAAWLIRPPRMYFAPRNIAVHGIHPRQVSSAPTMQDIWSQVHAFIEGEVVIAHNARFDINVLTSSLAAYHVSCPDLEFSCTRALARCGWPGRHRYGLKPLADSLGIRFRHHDALEDARCCAHIALAVARDHHASSLSELETTLRLKRGSVRAGKITSPLAIGRRKSASQGSSRQYADQWGFPSKRRTQTAGSVDPVAIKTASAGNQPLQGKRIVMLGTLRGLSIEETIELITDLGGTCRQSISPEVDYVVACGTSLENASHLICQQLADEPPSEDECQSTLGIRVLSERQFRALLPGGKTAGW